MANGIPSLALVVTSLVARLMPKHHRLRHQAGRLLSKPYRKEELRCAVREVLDEPR
jgi:hypothetical protein